MAHDNNSNGYGRKIARYVMCILCCLSCGILIIISGIPFKPKTRIKMAWISVTLLSIVIGIPFGFVTFGKRYVDTSSSDIAKITSRAYPFFCSSFNLKDSDHPVDVFKSYGTPVVLDNTTTYSYNKSAHVNFGKNHHWKYFLLKGSFITMHVDDANIDVYIVKGNTKFVLWKLIHSLFYELHSDARGQKDTPIMHNIKKSDYYYLIVDNHEYSSGLDVQVDIELNRTSYDFSSAKLYCEHKYNCSVPFSQPVTAESVVVISPDVKADTMLMSTRCDRRIAIFFILFFILPICIAIIWSTLIYCLCICAKRTR